MFYFIYLCVETKNSMIIAPNMCPFKEEIIEQLNEAKRKEREIRLLNFNSLVTQSEEETNKSTQSKLPFRQKWLLKETRADRYIEHDYKNVKLVILIPTSYAYILLISMNKLIFISDNFNV